jgi:hypothetical protein
MSRYFLQTEAEGRLLSIRDAETGNPRSEPMGWDEATRLCLELNKPRSAPKPDAAPCACCERMERATARILDGLEIVIPALYADSAEEMGRALVEARAILKGELNGRT